MLTPRIFFFYLFLSLTPAFGDWTKVLAVSPQRTWEIQCRQVGNLDEGDPQFIDFVDVKSGKIVFSFASTRRSTDAEWNSNGTLVGINDRTATSGDFLYIFRVMNHHVIPVRSPSEDSLSKSLLEIYKKFNASGRFTLTGRQWLNSSSLLIHVSGGGYGDDLSFEATVHVNPSGQISLDKKSARRIN